MSAFNPELKALLGTVLIAYLAFMVVIGWIARSKIHSSEDFLVAGRRLPLHLAWPTLLATWFGAGTLLTATDEVRSGGLTMATLDPLGAGLCLLLAGWLLSKPLWEMRLLTLADFFRRRFGKQAELFSGLAMLPTYFGWIAAQFVALAGLLHILFDIDPSIGIALVAGIGTLYTLLGGMWSVTLTDAIQMFLIAAGLIVLTVQVLALLNDNPILAVEQVFASLPPEKRTLIPREDATAFVGWLGVLAVGSLGNLPGQDLMQRVFASRSANTAKWACYIAGCAYLLLGVLPIFLGLAADVLLPHQQGESTLALLSGLFLHPLSATLLLLAVVSSVLSTIDSALLSPSSVLAENILPRTKLHQISALKRNRLALIFVAVVSLLTAYLGESAYGLLESAYALGLVSLLVPLLGGVLRPNFAGQKAALASMGVGTSLWLLHEVNGWENFGGPLLTIISLPNALCSAVIGLGVYCLVGSQTSK